MSSGKVEKELQSLLEEAKSRYLPGNKFYNAYYEDTLDSNIRSIPGSPEFRTAVPHEGIYIVNHGWVYFKGRWAVIVNKFKIYELW